MFGSGERIAYRLSGTGTEGATLRVYVERHEPDSERQKIDPQRGRAELIAVSKQIAQIERYSGRTAPDVIT